MMSRRFLLVVLLSLLCSQQIQADDAPTGRRTIPAARQAAQEAAMRGSISGIGAMLRQEEGGLTIVQTLAGGSAEKAGLTAGTRILNINGISTAGMAITDAVKLIKGPSGTTVTLTLQSSSGAIEEETLTRAKVVLGKPEASMPKPGIGLLKLSTFNGETLSETRAALEQLMNRGAKALILDLRGTGGGSPPVKKDVTSLFLPKGAPLWLIEWVETGERTLARSDVTGPYASVPLVVLVDSQTHGELPAAAIKRNRRGKLIGQRTSGASLLRSLTKAQDGTSRLDVKGRLFLDAKTPITGSGVVPDIELPADATNEDYLDAAFSLLGGRSLGGSSSAGKRTRGGGHAEM